MSCAKLANNEYDMKIGEGTPKRRITRVANRRAEPMVHYMYAVWYTSWVLAKKKNGMSDAIECGTTGARMIVETTRGGKKEITKEESKAENRQMLKVNECSGFDVQWKTGSCLLGR